MNEFKAFFVTIVFVAGIFFIGQLWLTDTSTQLTLRQLYLEIGFDSNKKALMDGLSNRYGYKVDYMLDESPWNITRNWMTTRYVNPDSAPEMGAILNKMAHGKIIKMELIADDVKFYITLEGDQKAIFKPKIYDRDEILDPEDKPEYPENGLRVADRHNGEVAAFQVNRLLALNRAPLVVGRIISPMEILSAASDRLISLIESSGSNTLCLTKQNDGLKYRICMDIMYGLEGALILWLPLPPRASIMIFRPYSAILPWYIVRKEARDIALRFNVQETGCALYTGLAALEKSPPLLDMFDTIIFDYLIGNVERRHIEALCITGYQHCPSILLINNGKSFGNPDKDNDDNFLSTIQSCCWVRRRTYDRLKSLSGGVLSSVLRQVLSKDPIAPVLTERHMDALDRRLKKLLVIIDTCIYNLGNEHVFGGKMSTE